MIINAKNMLMVLAAILVVALGVIGYVYYSQGVALGTMDKVTTTLQTQSNSDETDSIEKDLNDTEIDSLDNDLDSIEKEITP